MLGQVQFPTILRLTRGVNEVADFQEAIRDKFPGFGEEHQVQFALTAGAAPEAGAQQRTGYRFTSEDAAWSALLAPTALTLEAATKVEYSSFEKFSELFRDLWTAAIEYLKPGRITRQGLRYVDHLEADRSPQEWADWINPVLLGAAATDELSSGLERSLTEMIYAGDQGQLIFRHGITEAGPKNARGYLLDFDSVHLAPIDATDLDGVMARFDASHDQLYAFFRWCVTDKALEEFRNGG
jgi:uncharacterized protein (TIGR04255 family)